ncbi:hypothetical protein CDL15_Pgr026902 [Punica granatum]|uniref:Uncharacterized protein n=1 Tax=Punica granatum TaxID=22663 RepID=A0A218WMT8_PUNGR|nr:hypothetical protein CDL15_Pgr026902 [Punica granatum]PKI64422.1 hypothetical protein CRG98_015207 [Punica granatum]
MAKFIDLVKEHASIYAQIRKLKLIGVPTRVLVPTGSPSSSPNQNVCLPSALMNSSPYFHEERHLYAAKQELKTNSSAFDSAATSLSGILGLAITEVYYINGWHNNGRRNGKGIMAGEIRAAKEGRIMGMVAPLIVEQE